jgi:hypothetical protein
MTPRVPKMTMHRSIRITDSLWTCDYCEEDSDVVLCIESDINNPDEPSMWLCQGCVGKAYKCFD